MVNILKQSILSLENKNILKLSKFFPPNYSKLHVTVRLFRFWALVTSRFKIIPMPQIATIKLQSSSQMSTLTSSITPNLCTRLVCTKMLLRLFNKLKIEIWVIKSCNFKFQFSMNLKKFHMLNH